MPISGLIFDFDGLILDTEEPIFEIIQSIYREHGHELGLELWQAAIGTQHGFDPCAHLSELIGRPLEREAFYATLQERHHAACRDLPLMPGVLDLLDAAGEHGLRMAVASSSSHSWFEGWLSQHGIRERFGALCGREDVAQVKPAPDLFLLAAQQLELPPSECVVFEDSPNGALAAASANIRCVAVPNAITRTLEFPPVALRVDSLASLSLDDLLRRLEPVEARA